MIQKIEQYMVQQNMIEPGDVVVVGVSGGADSICLVHILAGLREKLQFDIKAVHIHHGIRGEEATRDEKYAVEFCQNLGISCEVKYYDVPALAKQTGESMEAVGRRVRYEAFSKVDGVTKIAVAHHKNDQAETVLFHMTRGTSLRGMGGMNAVNGMIIRPLLCVKRGDIEAYLKAKNIPYCMDSTNLSNDYARNRIRNQVISELEQVNAGAVEHIADLALDMQEAFGYIKSQAEKVMEQAVFRNEEQAIVLKTDVLRECCPYLRKEIISLTLEKLLPGLDEVNRGHLEQVEGLLEKNTSAQIDLPYGAVAVREYDGIAFYANDRNNVQDSRDNTGLFYGNEQKFDIKQECIELCVRDFDGNWKNQSNDYTKVFDYDKIKDKLSIRKRMPGDYIVLDDKGSKKSLKSFFIDRKIPQKYRDRIWLVTENHHVLWIIGQRISSYYKTDENTKRALVIRIRRNDDGLSDRRPD